MAIPQAEGFGAALATAQGIKDPHWQRRALIDIAITQREAGETDAARNTFEAVLVTAKEDTGSRRTDALSVLAKMLADAGEFDWALVAASQIQDAGPHDTALRSIAISLLKARLFDTPHNIIVDIHSPCKRGLLLSNLAVLQVWAGDRESAASSNDAALEIASGGDGRSWNDPILYDIEKAQARVGQAEAPLPTFDVVTAFQNWVLNDIAKRQAENGYQDAV